MNTGQGSKGKSSIARAVRKITRRSTDAVEAVTRREAHPVPASNPVTTSSIPEERIKSRAYEIFLSRGGAHGNDWLDWFQAERELVKQHR